MAQLNKGNGSTVSHAAASVESSTGRKLQQGIVPPVVTFFNGDESVDTETISKHNVRMLRAGCSAVVVLGSNGELQNITDREEKKQIVKATRQAFDAEGFESTPIVVGCSAMSVVDTIRNTRDAREAGGDFALVLPPSFYHNVLSRTEIIQFYKDVADESPIPVIIYNYPAAAAGIDLSDKDIRAIAEHQNVTGVKLTCGNSGKAARLALPTGSGKMSINHPFMVLAGTADWLIQGLSISAHGCVPGVANVLPRLCVKTMEAYRSGDLGEALRLQGILSRADAAAQAQNLVGTKLAIQKVLGYGAGRCRRPLASKLPEGWEEAWEEGIQAEKDLEKMAG